MGRSPALTVKGAADWFWIKPHNSFNFYNGKKSLDISRLQFGTNNMCEKAVVESGIVWPDDSVSSDMEIRAWPKAPPQLFEWKIFLGFHGCYTYTTVNHTLRHTKFCYFLADMDGKSLVWLNCDGPQNTAD